MEKSGILKICGFLKTTEILPISRQQSESNAYVAIHLAERDIIETVS